MFLQKIKGSITQYSFLFTREKIILLEKSYKVEYFDKLKDWKTFFSEYVVAVAFIVAF